jgi:hypothetical protein
MSFYNQFKFNTNTFPDVSYNYGDLQTVDILMDWEGQQSALYLNGTF